MAPQAQERFREEMAAVRQEMSGGQQKAYPPDPSGPDAATVGTPHDLGPWIETPSSSRVSRFRFDHLQRQLQVDWRNNKSPVYIYEDVDYEGYRAFARVASKGKHINAVLNGYAYHPVRNDEDMLPSNEKRRGVSSRLRT